MRRRSEHPPTLEIWWLDSNPAQHSTDAHTHDSAAQRRRQKFLMEKLVLGRRESLEQLAYVGFITWPPVSSHRHRHFDSDRRKKMPAQVSRAENISF
jgi:hypothetical protein